MLENIESWTAPNPSDEEEKAGSERQFWYHLKSYIVRKDDVSDIVGRLAGKSFMNDWMPHSSDRYDVFFREDSWSSRARFFKAEGYPEHEWSTIYDDADQKNAIGSGFVTSAKYTWPDEVDRFYLPSAFIREIMALRHGMVNGQMVDENGTMICFDPAGIDPELSMLLIRKKEFLHALEKNGFTIFWTVLGAKELIAFTSIVRELQFSGTATIDDNGFRDNLTYTQDPYLKSSEVGN